MAEMKSKWNMVRLFWVSCSVACASCVFAAAAEALPDNSKLPTGDTNTIHSSRLAISPLDPLQSSEWTSMSMLPTNILQEDPHGLNPVFRDSFNLVSSSNLVASLHDSDTISPEEQRQTLFNMARMHHAQKNYDQAAKFYQLILTSEASPSMKQYALVDLAVIAQEQEDLPKALQILAQYIRKFPNDTGVPEILLRQGLIYRQMGAPAMALGKFYGVMTSSLTLKKGNLDYYQRLVLQAQTEIAETSYATGKFDDAADFFTRLLKQEAPDLNKVQIRYKLIRSLAAANHLDEAINQAKFFLERHAGVAEEPEVRFILINGLKQTNLKQEALKQVLLLLRAEQQVAAKEPERWLYWQQRAGNEIGNQLYQEFDYLNALEVYTSLAALNNDPRWQLPVLYQIGLVYEHLQQPQKAVETYQRIMARQKELASNAPSGVKTVVDMAIWRNDFLNWHTQAERYSQTNALNVSPGLRNSRSTLSARQ